MIVREIIIAIQPLGDVRGDVLHALETGLQAAYGIQTACLAGEPLPGEAFEPQRGQHNCYPILNRLNALRPEQAVKILGVTEVDLFIPILTYVFGEAELGGHAAVISTARLSRDLDEESHPMPRILERAAKVAVHELAHTFDLQHCKEDGCLMGTFPALPNLDEKPIQFCRYCRTFLRDGYEKLGLSRVEGVGDVKANAP